MGMTGGDPSKIGMLDAENMRGLLSADVLPAPFMHANFCAPFSPERYIKGINEFQEAGMKVLIIDSFSHAWEGIGGCDDIAIHKGTAKKKNWIAAKAEWKKLTNAYLQCDMHIILCMRAREKTDHSDIYKMKSLGLQPITEKNTMYEMTVSMMMYNKGYNQDFLKMPAELAPIFGNGEGYLNETHGKALIDWVDSGIKIDKDVSLWESKLQMSCDNGTASLIECWGSVPNKLKSKLLAYKDRCKSSAAEFDVMIKQREEIDAQEVLTKQGKATGAASVDESMFEGEGRPELTVDSDIKDQVVTGQNAMNAIENMTNDPTMKDPNAESDFDWS